MVQQLRQEPLQEQKKRQTQKQVMVLIGGMTGTIFPELANHLLYDSEMRKAVRAVVSDPEMDKFRSMVDYIFCGLFPEHLEACFLYYEDKGPLLKDIISGDEIVRAERLLIAACKLATIFFNRDEPVMWIRLNELVTKE
ncbi:MAG: hypothetical protein ABH884_00045 [Candidatus Komeilibacteria bacterium]